MWGALLVAAAMLAGGCSADTPPPPDPDKIELPPRPREVRVDGVDPCSLLTTEQRAELGLDGSPLFGTGPSELYPGADVPTCAIRGYEPRAVVVGVSNVTTTGIELYTSGRLVAEVRAAEVRGFPAVVAVPIRHTDGCTVIVDVAPGQLLDIQFADGGRLPPIPQPELCRGAQVTADAVMVTLLASH
ncbi:DUF3558 domain-containing protein [Pseudonocardia xinjiangensis]|uniref:DUF3558 domain-containing protein n=1 Tax=Pseudonocardia xinjiangensis TaxID=75289 RepID=UPI003D9388AA